MLQITVHNDKGATRLKIEGRLMGAWAQRVGKLLASSDGRTASTARPR